MIHLVIEGISRPQGSKRHVGKGVMIESSKHVGLWRTWVRLKAVQAMAGRPQILGPVQIAILFEFDRPKKHSTTKGLRESAPQYHTCKPDADKLLRAILDALTGVVFKDDSQVAYCLVRKHYGRAAQTVIDIAELADDKTMGGGKFHYGEPQPMKPRNVDHYDRPED